MTGWTFSPALRSLFRAAGLGLLGCYLVIALSRIYPLGALAQPAAVLRLIDQLLDQGPLLCIALLLLLLSLSAYILPPPDGESPPAPGHRDSLLMRGRGLVGLMAVAYLALVPLTLVQAQTVKNIGDRVIERRQAELGSLLKQVDQRIAAPAVGSGGAKDQGEASGLSVAAFKQRFAWANRPEIRTPADLRALLRATRDKAARYYPALQAAGRRDLLLQSIRRSLLATLYGALIGYLWLQWPRWRPSLKDWRRRAPGIGMDLEAAAAEAYFEGGDSLQRAIELDAPSSR